MKQYTEFPEFRLEKDNRSHQEESIEELDEFRRRLQLFGLDEMWTNQSGGENTISTLCPSESRPPESRSVGSLSVSAADTFGLEEHDENIGGHFTRNGERGVMSQGHREIQRGKTTTVKDRKRMNKKSREKRLSVSF